MGRGPPPPGSPPPPRHCRGKRFGRIHGPSASIKYPPRPARNTLTIAPSARFTTSWNHHQEFDEVDCFSSPKHSLPSTFSSSLPSANPIPPRRAPSSPDTSFRDRFRSPASGLPSARLALLCQPIANASRHFPPYPEHACLSLLYRIAPRLPLSVVPRKLLEPVIPGRSPGPSSLSSPGVIAGHRAGSSSSNPFREALPFPLIQPPACPCPGAIPARQ